MVVLVALVFGERLTPISVTAVFSGFLGIVLIRRPVEFDWATIVALGSALSHSERSAS